MEGSDADSPELFEGDGQEIHKDVRLCLSEPALGYFSLVQVAEQIALI